MFFGYFNILKSLKKNTKYHNFKHIKYYIGCASMAHMLAIAIAMSQVE